MIARRLPFAAVCAASVLAGCAVFEEDAEVAANCPSVATLDSAQTLTRFGPGSGRESSAVELEVRLDGTAPTACRVDGRTAVVEMPVRMSVSRGPASSGRQAGFGYFVAVSDPDGRITAREGFDLNVNFPDNRAQASAVDEVVTRIPLPPGDRLEDYRLIIGLQLTREELDYNRQNLPR